jgi:hypothetical protein
LFLPKILTGSWKFLTYKMCKYFLFCFLLSSFIFSHPVLAQIDSIQQAEPTTKKDKEDKLKRRKLNKGPRKALLLSAVAPGLGQLYNEKYWKAPVIWVGLGIVTYFYLDNAIYFRLYKNAYQAAYDTSLVNPTKPVFVPITDHGVSHNFTSINQLSQGTNTYRRYRDMSLIIGAAIYVLNIVDANVDAHLKEFDIGEELSLKVSPLLYANINRQFTTGITLNFTFKK